MSELSEARERYKRHLAAQESDSPSQSPYHYDYCVDNTLEISVALWQDLQLLARAACDVHPDTRRLNWWLSPDVKSRASIEIFKRGAVEGWSLERWRTEIDAAIDAAREQPK